MFGPVALFGVAIVSCVMSVAIFGSLLEAGVPGLGRWISAYVMFGAAFALLVWQADLPTSGVIVCVNAMALAGSILVLQGMRQFFRRPLWYRGEQVAFVAAIAGLIYWTFISPSASARIVLTSSLFVYVRTLVGWMAFRLRPAHRPKYSYRFVAIGAFAGAGVHVVRALVYGAGWERQMTPFDPSPLNLTLLGVSILSLPCLSIGMVMLAHDRLSECMERLATVDELTGALVRRAFFEKAEGLTREARKTCTPLSIAIVDLDHFKSVNDRFGHAAGDRALACFASVVAAAIGPRDVFGRLGGEEFAVLFVSKDKAAAQRFTNELRALLAVSPSNEAACTFSAGIEQIEAGDTLASAMARADAALYVAKARGRNCVIGTPPVGDRLIAES